jgi:hypothetical protein
MKYFRYPLYLITACCFLLSCTPKHNINFINEVQLKPIADNQYILLNNYKAFDGTRMYTVPKGFVTDFASIPRFLWPLFNPNEFKVIPPAILHDYLYYCPNGISRAEVDSIFYSSLIDNLVNPVKAYTYYLAVRLGGWRHFNRDNHCASSEKEYSQKISN